jgi:uncharacterized protein DUF1707/cell wall-active antibiotic response 4TMS protein YvqF
VSHLPSPDERHLLRVSDADREQVTERLREAAGQGRITMDELDTRLDATYTAKTYAQLAEITRDLPVEGSAALAVGGSDTFAVERMGGTPRRRVSLAILSGSRRKGTWVVPPVYTAVALLGGVDMDLREAKFSQRDVRIRAYAILGGVNIIVPEDIEVDVGGIGIMGGFDHKETGSRWRVSLSAPVARGVPNAPRLRISGLAFMGGVNVKRKRKKQRPELEGGNPS